MNNLNSTLLEGNLVRDPDLRSLSNGTPVCNFTIANNYFYKKDDAIIKEVSFFDVEAWGKLAERCSVTGKKGKEVRVVGRLKMDSWKDKEGKNHSKVKLVAESVEFKHEHKRENTTVQEPDIEKGFER